MNEVEKKEIEDWNIDDIELVIMNNIKNPKTTLYMDDCSRISKALYNAGYGKVEDYKKEIERLKEENKKLRYNILLKEGQISSLNKVAENYAFLKKHIDYDTILDIIDFSKTEYDIMGRKQINTIVGIPLSEAVQVLLKYKNKKREK